VETPAKIDFEGCEETARFRGRIEDRIAMLEGRFGRITSCRVTMRAPSGHHRNGSPYEVLVHLELPGGRQVDVDREPPRDERYGDPIFAINDAFRRARRVLLDEVRQHLHGEVKFHDGQPVGTVLFLKPDEDYGFLTSADGRDVYFHRNSVLNGGFDKLNRGERVTFVEQPGDKGPQASTVRPVAHTRKA
jgi:cold shock CspA family protein